MAEPTIICPKCKNEIKLTESLAAPLIESTRREFEQRLAQKDIDIASREKSVRAGEEALAKAKESLDTQVAEKLQQERARIAAEEAKKAKLALGNDLNQKAKEVSDLHEILKQRDEKLAEAQKVQAELIKKQRELDDAKRELDLTVEKRVQAGSRSRISNAGPNRDRSSFKVRFRNLSLKRCYAPNSRATPSSLYQKVNTAVMPCSALSDRWAKCAARYCGNRNARRTGPKAGWPSSATISGRPRRKSPCWSVKRFLRTWKLSTWLTQCG